MSDQLAVRCIRKRENMMWPLELSDEARRVLEHLSKSLALGFRLPANQNSVCSLNDNSDNASGFAIFGDYR